MFKDKTLLIVGGTGSFGNAAVKRFLDTDIKEIRIFSRDEKKQDDMRKLFNNKKLKFYIGDVRRFEGLLSALRGVDYVFQAAALKQVPSCEFYPAEAVRTNILGTENVIRAAIQNKVKKVIVLSTDKAVSPINAMGMSKALMEKIVVAESRNLTAEDTVLCATRYGNVMASRGSVIPLFIDQIKANQPITVTDPHMTRFLMFLEEAIDLVLYAFEHGSQGDIFVKKAPAAKIGDLADTIKEIFNIKTATVTIGTRHGEKKHESLLGREEMVHAEDCGDYYRVKPDARDLNYNKYFSEGQPSVSEMREYSSDITEQLKGEKLKKLLLKLDCVQEALRTH